MKRLLIGIAIFGVAALLGGCPIYPSQGNEYRVCQADGCYSCPDTSYSGGCIKWQCSQNSDCGDGYVCNDEALCVAAPPDLEAGECSVDGCPDCCVCTQSGGQVRCVVALGGNGGGVDGSNAVDGGSHDDSGVRGDAASATDSAISPGDAAIPVGDSATSGDATDAASSLVPCNADGDCGGKGARCVDGACAAQVDLCSDGTQCVVAGYSCVDGLCEATCSGTLPCPSGYGCDFTRGVCDLDPGACVGSGASTCQGGATCVDGHCVPPCSAGAEGAASCAGGQVCVNGGCIPDQAATFACLNDGDQGLLSNDCPTGFTCLHHDCYAACDVDASAGACGSATCKDVTIETGTYGVCAAPGTLGSDCDPAQGKACASGVCINGSCE
jgi:hypothetical protein